MKVIKQYGINEPIPEGATYLKTITETHPYTGSKFTSHHFLIDIDEKDYQETQKEITKMKIESEKRPWWSCK